MNDDQKVITNMRLSIFHRAVFQQLGGVKWLRRILDREAKKSERSKTKNLQM